MNINECNLKTESEELINLLETNGTKYYKTLCKLHKNYSNEEIKKILNYTHYTCYYGHQLHGLIDVVGNLVNYPTIGVYGNNISVSEDLGIKILDEFIKYEIDLDLKDYYNRTPLQNLMNTTKLTARKNNKRFKKKMQDYYINRLNKTLVKKISILID